MNFKSGFTAIIGRPNVGKSTLLNTLIGKKIVIMSEKPQTTRNKITGVLTGSDFQIVFIDTPGIHKPKNKLGELMVELAENSIKDVDLILYLVDATAPIGKGDEFVNGILVNSKVPVIIGLNKIDNLTKEEIPRVKELWRQSGVTQKVVPISALQQINLDVLIEEIKVMLPEGPKYFPDDMVTDQPENLVVAEIIREKVLSFTMEEVPHSTAVVVESMEERANGILYVAATIYVERDSQKGIMIGKGASKIKEIGNAARVELEGILNTQIYLDLRVKVRKNWRKSDLDLRKMGYDPKFLK
ncbi:MAG: GTPase Era [Bacillota bacterium]